VISNALDESFAVGVIAHADVLTPQEQDENLEWLACHILAALWSHGYLVQRVRREKDGPGRPGLT
jgi:hypothetical protein